MHTQPTNGDHNPANDESPAPPKNTWVEHTQQLGLRGIFTGGVRNQGPIESWEVECGPGDRRWIPKQFLRFASADDPAGFSLLQLLEQRRFASVDVLRRLMTHEKLRGTLTEVIYSMDAAQIDFYPYQFKPVLKFIESPADRLVLADEVGLGKTIEAALIWLELRARRQARRLLVVCHSAMLAEKWQKELREKFEIEAIISDFGDLKATIDRLEDEGPFSAFAVVATYSGIRPSRRDAHRLDSPDEDIVRDFGPKAAWLRKLRQWEHDHAPFDLVIFDEAHYMRNPETAAFRLGESLALNAGAVLCVSATPLCNTNEDLRTLLRLVDPDFFSNASVFDEMIRENRPAVRAGNALAGARPNLSIAREAIGHLENSRYLRGSALLRQARDAVEMLQPGDRHHLSEAQGLVEKLNILGTYVNRTRRVQVEEMRAVRDPKIIPVDYSPEESALYNAILGFVRERAAGIGRDFHFFEVIGWQLRAASCLPAVAQRIRGHQDDDENLWIESFGEVRPEEDSESAAIEEPNLGDNTIGVAPIASDWRKLLDYDFEANDGKFEQLRKILLSELRDEKCIIFSYYRATLAYLERRLAQDGIACAVIHGGVPPDERSSVVERFEPDPQIRVLLSSEVGSEGIDLQFCSVLINYDLPWNPMRVEQRIGRIDRVGQKAERLRIYHFKIRGTVEERVLLKLHMRLELFRNSLGDLDAVLGEEIEKLTRELFSRKLTPKQEEERIEQTALVIERKHREMEELESRGEGLVAMADYLQQKIRGSRGLGRYVTAEELEEVIHDFCVRHGGIDLRWDDPNPYCFRLKLRPDIQSELASFLGADRSLAAQRLRARDFCICLRPEVFRELPLTVRRRVLFINHLSPLIRWITDRNQRRTDLFQRVSIARLATVEYSPGLWVYLIRRWSFRGGLSSQRMAYVAVGPNDELLDGDDAEKLVVQVLQEGAAWDYPECDQGRILESYRRATSALDQEKGSAFVNFAAENENYVQIRRRRTEAHFQRRIRHDQERLATARAKDNRPQAVRGFEGMLRSERESLELRLSELERNAIATSEEADVAAGLIEIEESRS